MMQGVLYLALRYVRYHWLPSLLLASALTLSIMLPLATRWTIQAIRHQALERAEQTPLVIGAKGSTFGLTLHALYFRGDVPPTIPYSQYTRVTEQQPGGVIPLLARYRAQGRLIVGTSEEYLIKRNLLLAAGEPLERWGDCLVGSNAAEDLQLNPGSSVTTEPENMLDLSGPAPLELRVRGVLKRTGTPDDDVIFCHLETAWIIAGIGHGHALTKSTDSASTATEQLATESSSHTDQHAAENTQHFSSITPENLQTFHFHGNRADYPLTGLLVFPESARSATLLEGKFLSPKETCQVVIPLRVVNEFLELVARLRQLLDAVSFILAIVTALLVLLVISLSLRLRQKEIEILKLLGAGRWKIVQIIGAELMLIFLVSSLALVPWRTWLLGWRYG